MACQEIIEGFFKQLQYSILIKEYPKSKPTEEVHEERANSFSLRT